VIKTNCSYVGGPEAHFRMPAVLPGSAAAPLVAAAAWPITDAVRAHVTAAQLKRSIDVFPSGTRGTDPPV
jgi:hypothetical protein